MQITEKLKKKKKKKKKKIKKVQSNATTPSWDKMGWSR